MGPIVSTAVPAHLRNPEHWMRPHKDNVPNDYLPYNGVSVGKYHPKVQVLRLRRLLDVCTKARATGAAPGSNGTWLQEYSRRTIEEEVVSSNAGLQVLPASHPRWPYAAPSWDQLNGHPFSFLDFPSPLHSFSFLFSYAYPYPQGEL